MFELMLIVVCIGLSAFYLVLKKKNMDNWIINYLKQCVFKKKVLGIKHIMFCYVDHYEPKWKNPDDLELERQRVERWHTEYPIVAGKHQDADGVHPQHSFFYPQEEYRYEHLAKLSDLCARGFGEIEVHLHHDDDTSDNLRATLEGFTELLHIEHGAFTRNESTGKLNYSFIHGNWSLCNSRKDGRYCGVNDELVVLNETGCYADFTYPSAPSDTQTSTINTIYYASDKRGCSKSHDVGVDVKVGGNESGDLMIIQGPLALNFNRLKKMIFPQIESSDIRKSMPPSNDRVDLWVKTGVHVKDKPDWIFIKIHTHGTQDGDMETLLGQPFDDMCTYLEKKYNDGENYVLHYVTARETYNIIKAAEAGENGDPNLYRDYELARPKNMLMKNLSKKVA